MNNILLNLIAQFHLNVVERCLVEWKLFIVLVQIRNNDHVRL
jgi:hypothetical protein